MLLMNGKSFLSTSRMDIDTSLHRGIDVVRNKIKTFAQKKVTLPPGRHKIIILDEADRCAVSSPLHICIKQSELINSVRQYDSRCSTSFTKNDGNLFEHDAFCSGVQPVDQDH